VHVEKGHRLPVHTDGLARPKLQIATFSDFQVSCHGDIPASAASQAELSKVYACFLYINLYFSD
jgi:hypothetical protein